jgi:hypothetical protein
MLHPEHFLPGQTVLTAYPTQGDRKDYVPAEDDVFASHMILATLPSPPSALVTVVSSSLGSMSFS